MPAMVDVVLYPKGNRRPSSKTFLFFGGCDSSQVYQLIRIPFCGGM
jgi:predicted transposase YdaD